jgi:ribosomal protein S18 acetylase RimI-like enzyme
MAEHTYTFKEEHLDECATLLVATFNTEPWNDKYTLDTARKQLAWHLRVPGCVGLISVRDGIVAFAIGFREPTDIGEVFHLSIFCVRPDMHRTGAGSRLLHTLEDRLRESGIRTVYLGTRKGTPAEAFYRKYGYEASAEDIEMSHELDDSGRG